MTHNSTYTSLTSFILASLFMYSMCHVVRIIPAMLVGPTGSLSPHSLLLLSLIIVFRCVCQCVSVCVRWLGAGWQDGKLQYINHWFEWIVEQSNTPTKLISKKTNAHLSLTKVMFLTIQRFKVEKQLWGKGEHLHWKLYKNNNSQRSRLFGWPIK